jgi:hypothetical protein
MDWGMIVLLLMTLGVLGIVVEWVKQDLKS